MIKLLGLILLLLIANYQISVSQVVLEIGDNSNEIAQKIEWLTKDHNSSDSYGNVSSSRWSYDIKYSNGKIIDVIQCRSNELILEFRMVTSYCKHYVMEGGKLAYILNQYEQISLDQLKVFYETRYAEQKIGKYYFSDDYKHYTQLYLHDNGYATGEWRTTNIAEFPNEMKPLISKRLKAMEVENNQRQIELENKRQEIRDVRSKIYDIEIEDKALYSERKEFLKKSILEYLRNESSERGSETPYYSYGPNVYDLTYTLSEVSSSYPTEISCVSISGTDRDCVLFKKKALVLMMPTKIRDIEVRTKASYKNFKVIYFHGEVKVTKGKNGEIKIKGDFPVNTIVVDGINQELKTYDKGRYLIIYEVGEFGDDRFSFIDVY